MHLKLNIDIEHKLKDVQKWPPTDQSKKEMFGQLQKQGLVMRIHTLVHKCQLNIFGAYLRKPLYCKIQVIYSKLP